MINFKNIILIKINKCKKNLYSVILFISNLKLDIIKLVFMDI